MTRFGGVLESFLLSSGRERLLQALPDYTSPPNEFALESTPALYRSDEVVQEARDLDAAGNCTIDGNRCQIPFPVDEDKFEEPSQVGVVFYCGGLVDPRGYSPIAALLAERYGMPVVMPIFEGDRAFAFGTCDSGRLDFAQAEFPDVEKWVLAGHSFGGVAATVDMWSRWNAMDESAAGLVLLAADVQEGLGCGATDFSGTDLPMAQLLAANDGILNFTRVEMNAARNSNATFDMLIQGANHASFGDYDYSERFELLGQVDGESLFPDSIAWDLAAAAIAQVGARTGASLATPKATHTGDSGDEAFDRCPPTTEEVTASKSGTEEATKSETPSSGATIITATLLSGALAFFVGWN